MRTEDRVLAMVMPICQTIGCEVVDVEWKKEGSDWFLRIFIDREPSVDHALCAEVSRAVGDALDTEDFIESNYVLEVSSPGLERPLKKATDFQRFAGKNVVVKLFAAVDGKKEFTGELMGYGENGVCIKDRADGQEYAFPLDKIAKAHLLFEF